MEYAANMNRISIISMLQIIVSLIFWAWAWFNNFTRKLPFDSGIIIFVLPFVTGIFGLQSAQSNGVRTRPLAEKHFRYTRISHVLVTISFIGGAFLPQLSSAFCILCAFLWAVTGLVFTRSIQDRIRLLGTHKE